MLQLLDSGLVSVLHHPHLLGNHFQVLFALTRLITYPPFVLILQRNEFRPVAVCVFLGPLVQSLAFGLVEVFELGE
jgi:hypothetical protein